MEPQIVSCPIPKAASQQFAQLVNWAGEIVTNILVAGGSAVTLRVGSYQRGKHPQTGQLIEKFVPNVIDPSTGELLLEAIVAPAAVEGLRSLTGAGSGSQINPFSVNIWPLTSGLRPTTVAEALGARMLQMPGYQGSTSHLAMAVYSNQAMFELKKAISSIFAVGLVRQSPDLGIMLQRGGDSLYERQVSKVRKVPKQVEQKKRDAQGGFIFREAVDGEGKPVYEPVLHPKTKMPVYDPNTGEVRRRRTLIYETEMVTVQVDEPYTDTIQEMRTQLYLMVAKNSVIKDEDFLSISANESAYDPTWMLPDVLSGACRKRQPFHGMGGPEEGT